MNTKEFWKLIEQSITQNEITDPCDQSEKLIAILSKKEIQNIMGFQTKMEELQQDIFSSELKEVATHLGYGDSSYVFKGFVNWLIVLGENHYNKIRETPNYLLTLEREGYFVQNSPYFQDLNFVASGAFYEKFGLEADWDSALWKYRKSNREKELIKKSPIKNEPNLEI